MTDGGDSFPFGAGIAIRRTVYESIAMFPGFRTLELASVVLAGCCLLSPAVTSGADKENRDRKDTIAAIEYLGQVDCVAFPEAQDVLVDYVQNHEFEDVRFAAAKALFQQLQRGRRPLNALNGWREIPDPFILEQIVLLSTFRQPYTFEELNEKYAQRKVEKEQEAAAENGRKDLQQGCLNDGTIKGLARVAYSKDEFDCWVEPSERVRKEAENAILVALGVEQAQQRLEEILAMPDPMPPMDLTDPTKPMPPVQPQPEIDTSQLLTVIQQQGQARGPIGAQIGFQGRADTANRFNLIDGISAAPRTRAWFAFQFLSQQNNATQITADTTRFFNEFTDTSMPGLDSNPAFVDLNSVSSQLEFIQVTGFGSGLTPASSPQVDPFSDDLEMTRDELRRQFFAQNTGGKDEAFLQLGNTNLYRFGFEYALTPDFSVGMQAQYLTPLDPEVQQPDTFSNPLILLKHVLYRDDNQLLASLFGVSPQIPQDQISIVERTTRVNPGLIYFKQMPQDDRWFMQAGTAFSLPIDTQQVFTWDWAFGVGYWLYRDESLIDPEALQYEDKFLLGIIPQFEVLGKHIIGDSTVRGAFGLISAPPTAAAGTVSSRTDSTILVYQDGTPLTVAAFEFEEPRHVVDITAAVAFVLRGNWTYSTGLSIPVTSGNARSLEFLTTLSKNF